MALVFCFVFFALYTDDVGLHTLSHLCHDPFLLLDFSLSSFWQRIIIGTTKERIYLGNRWRTFKVVDRFWILGTFW